MGDTTGIGWTTHTWNPWRGCNHVSPGCDHCYIDMVFKRGGWGPAFKGPIRTSAAHWALPYKWNAAAEAAHERRKVFTCSLSDFFHSRADDWRAEAWDIIRATPWLDWLILTKRHKNIAKRLPADWSRGFPNVWMGVSVESPDYTKRLDYLADVPARLRYVSAEPLLAGIDLTPWMDRGVLDWVITGCERAGKDKRRHMETDWIRDIDAQCKRFRVPHYFKQYYEGTTLDDTSHLLDGVERAEFPKSRCVVISRRHSIADAI